VRRPLARYDLISCAATELMNHEESPLAKRALIGDFRFEIWLTRQEQLRTHANLASVPVCAGVFQSLLVLVAIVVCKSAECSPNRRVFKIARLGHGFFNLINLLFFLSFDGLVSKDLIFRHVKETSGV